MPREKKENMDKTESKKAKKSQTTSKEKTTKSSKQANDNSNVNKKATTSKKLETAKDKNENVKVAAKNAKNDDSKITARNTKSAKNVKKQAKANEDRIRKIITEQLSNINEMEQNARKASKEEVDKLKEEALEKAKVLKNNNSTKKVNKSNNKKETDKQKKENIDRKQKATVSIKRNKKEKEPKAIQEETIVEQKENKKDAQIEKKAKFDPKAVAQKIENKKHLPKEEKNNINKKVLINLIVACISALYLIFVGLGFKNIEPSKFAIDLKVFSIALIGITIFVFEKAYQADSGVITIYGIETLFLSIATLSFTYLHITYSGKFNNIVNIICLLYIGYYIAKSIIIYLHHKVQYRQKISDVKEIISE